MKAVILLFLLTAFISTGSSYGQKMPKKVTITGYVVDKDLFPVTKADVLIDGEKSGILTDSRGFYSIRVKKDARRIGIMTFAKSSVEEDLNGRTRVNFAFERSIPDPGIYGITDPSEEEINVGYGTVRKRDLTSPVGMIDGQDKRFASYGSIYELLRGEVPGVHVTDRTIRIRGANSVNTSPAPLFVVDGVSVRNIDHIQPQMVKSIEVLKGPSASIYGSRGSNGVILIDLLTINGKR